MAVVASLQRSVILLVGLTITNSAQAIAPPPLVKAPASTIQSSPANTLEPQHPARVLPANAAGLIVIDTQPEKWIELTRFGLFPPDFSAPSSLFELLAPETTFATDIQPWIGKKFALGYLSDPRLEDKNFVVIAPVQAPEKIPQFLATVAQKQDRPVKLETYQGIEIHHWAATEFKIIDDDDATIGDLPASAPIVIPGWTIAYLPEGFVIAGETPAAIKHVIEQRQQANFSTTNAFREIQAHPQADRALIIGGGDYAKFIPLLTKLPTGLNAENRPSAIATLPNLPFNPLDFAQAISAIGDEFETFGGAVWATPQGLRIQSSATLKEPLPPQQTPPQSAPILAQVPANSYGVITAQGGLQGLAKSLSLDTGNPNKDGRSTVKNPAISLLAGPLEQLSQRLLGVDSSDIVPWVNGELALFAFPTKRGQLSQRFKVDLGLGAVIQTRDRDLAENTLSKIMRHLQEQNPQTLQSAKQTIKDTEVISLNTIAQGTTPKNLFSYSWIKPDTVLIQSAIDPLLIPQPWQPLEQSPNFQVALEALPPSDLGYFYLNSSSTTALIFNSVIPNFAGKRLAQNPFINEMRNLVSNVRSIAGTTRATGKTITNDGLILLNRNRQPQLQTAANWVEAAATQLTQQRPAWAVANYSQALRLRPNSPKILLARGQARVKSGDAFGSLEDFNAAIALTPPNTPERNMLYQYRATSYLATFQYAAAIADLNHNIQNQLNLASSYRDRSTANLALGNYQAALDDATQAIQRQPSMESYSHRCYARARLGDFQAAKRDCQQGSQSPSPSRLVDRRDWLNQPHTQSRSPNLDLQSAQCYVQAGLGESSAIKLCDRAIELDPKRPLYQENKGLAYALLQQPDKAQTALEKAAELFKQQGDRVGLARVNQLLERLR